MDLSDDPQSELGDGDANDIYIWTTSAPDELSPIDKKVAVRADSILGVTRIGQMSKKQPPTSDNEPENKGLYMHVYCQTDIKTASWMVKAILPLVSNNLQEWGNIFRQYTLDNYERLKEHVDN